MVYSGIGIILLGWFGVEAYMLGSVYVLFEQIYNTCIPIIIGVFVFNAIINISRYF